MTQTLTDSYNRTIDYLRISVTDRCNLRCSYCVPPTPFAHMNHTDILSYEELIRLVRVGISLGIRKVRLTGGEPFARKGLIGFIRELSALEGLEDLAVTTNGTLIADEMKNLKEAGLTRINISLDSLRPERFAKITGKDLFAEVKRTIEGALKTGLNPVKINTVLLDGINGDELEDFARLTFDHPVHIRFIEYMPIGEGSGPAHSELLAPAITRRLEALGPLTPVHRSAHDGPAQRFKIKGAKGEIGLISPMTNHFCATCNRLRLTADGHLRPCLLSDAKVNLMDAVRGSADDATLATLFRHAAGIKGKRHDLTGHAVHDMMSSIGG
ncbi:GTP 3',8-cyclase MoaA [Desulfoluna spongiiphila]|uniref:GTP 3',8-cyclase n=1 Tax=Desulfoluna spongiiphila TaxID=419481 RepID=A0A1G5CQ50_9BACT|nr:GTP 3',8-cyclase MoaA [Desulfoluna spongiiphila]SCY04381.1 cyclic pyranopterin monophosphate synthase subunit MoaA [Desulfoluna spongiiphila]